MKSKKIIFHHKNKNKKAKILNNCELKNFDGHKEEEKEEEKTNSDEELKEKFGSMVTHTNKENSTKWDKLFIIIIY